ncbi:MAG: hypothetical protein R6V32_06005, partial [Bacteroidales bacterium]
FISFSSIENDTINGFYTVNDLIKSYTTDNMYFEMVLFNEDTLYFYSCNKNILSKDPGTPIDLNNLNFKFGKYYYLYSKGKFNLGQKHYFENNKDSLIKVKGNNIPDLPDLRMPEKDTTPLPKERNKPS